MEQTIRWPQGKRCAFAISFDLDGESPWIHRDPALAERPLHMAMGAYGPKTGAPRILRVLDRYGIKAGWFIPGWIIERYPDLCREIARRGHEIGHHGYLHEKPFFLAGGVEEEEALLLRTLDVFTSVLGARPQGSRVPSADPSKDSMGLLRKHDFVYHSNFMDADLPYCHKTPYGELVELPTAWCTNDWPFFGFSAVPPVGNGIWSQEDVFEVWKEEFEGAYEEGGFFNLMGHPQVIGRPSRMRMVARLLEHILGKGDVWIARPIEVAEHYLSQR
jgi:peptidoglycan/xylan/chitin deacetylase (PgdA/CDA1 family)